MTGGEAQGRVTEAERCTEDDAGRGIALVVGSPCSVRLSDNDPSPLGPGAKAARRIMATDHADQETAALDYDQLLARCLGNLDFAERILTKFQQRFGEELKQIEQGLNLVDPEQIARVAHSLKGASATVAAPGLAAEMAGIESLARASRLEEIPGCLDRLQDEWARFVDSAAAHGTQALESP